MKKKSLSILLLLLLYVTQALAYDHFRLIISEGSSNQTLMNKIERTVSTLMTEINRCQEENKSVLELSIQYTPEAKQQLDMLWKNDHFRTKSTELVERLLTTHDGYQVRNIPLYVYNAKTGEAQDYQEVVISFNREGAVTSFYYTINPELYSKLFITKAQERKREVKDIKDRMMILNYVEHFRTAYNQKDLKFMREVFSDDALIIVGNVVRVKKSEVTPSGKMIKYISQNKQQYLTGLAKVFKSNSYIKVTFDDVLIVEHPTIRGIYGVTVRQSWKTSHYSDEGFVFMMWDFRNPDAPQIHVRTWQPEYIDKARGQRLNRKDVFNLGDFDL